MGQPKIRGVIPNILSLFRENDLPEALWENILCNKPSGFGGDRIFDHGCALVKYSVTFQNLQAGDKIYDLNLLTTNIIFVRYLQWLDMYWSDYTVANYILVGLYGC